MALQDEHSKALDRLSVTMRQNGLLEAATIAAEMTLKAPTRAEAEFGNQIVEAIKACFQSYCSPQAPVAPDSEAKSNV